MYPSRPVLSFSKSIICSFHVSPWLPCTWYKLEMVIILFWRHNGRDGVSNHRRFNCYSTFYSGADQRKHQSSVSQAFVQGIHRRRSLALVRGINRWPVYSPHKGPVTRKMFPFDDVIMHDWWWTNYANSQRISSHDTGLVAWIKPAR